MALLSYRCGSTDNRTAEHEKCRGNVYDTENVTWVACQCECHLVVDTIEETLTEPLAVSPTDFNTYLDDLVTRMEDALVRLEAALDRISS